MKSATSSFSRALFSAAAILLATVAATEIFQSLSAQTPDFHGAPASAAAIENPHTGVQDLEAGQAVFKQNCAVCHGPVGQGTGNIPSLAKGPAQSAKAGELFWFITKGDPTNAMPSWAQLPQEQRWQVVTFLQHLPSGSAAAAALAPEAANTHAFVGPPSRPPFTDFRVERPGAVRKITVADLPAPFASQSAGNAPRIVPRPEGVWPQALPGFKVELYASGLENPRLIRTAPNGDYFLAETAKGRIIVFRGITAEGKPEITSIFASGLRQPFGIAFYPKGSNPQWVYIGDTDAVVRFPYKNGDLTASGVPVHMADLPSNGRGHTTRDIRFTPDDKKMLVSVGSGSNVDDPETHPDEKDRADVLEFNPDGTGQRVYAYGIRNCVGEAINPITGELWCSVNERDALGDNLVPDYITHVQPGGFYGWPWWYMGQHQDPRHEGKHPELKDKVITPDVLLNPHNASLEMTFYDGKQFPAEYSGDIFAAEHGSWNRAVRVGYEVIRIPLHQIGRATGDYEDFLTGFVLPSGDVWGRPVGVTVATDGSLLVSDDGSNSVWRVSYAVK